MSGVSAFMDLVHRIVEHLEEESLSSGFWEPIRRGSAEGFVTAIPSDEEGDELILMVRLAIMPPPDGADRSALAHRLLELNHGLLGRASFSLDPDGSVQLTAGRPVADLDPGEILDLILWTAEQADRLDDGLIAEFGAGGG